MKFSIKDFFSKCDQIRSFLRIWSHLLKKSLMGNSIFCAVICRFVILILDKRMYRFDNKYNKLNLAEHLRWSIFAKRVIC